MINQLEFRNSLYEAMKIFNNAALKEAGVTQIISGKIIDTNFEEGEYTISYLGNKIYAHSSGGEQYNINDEVYILIPYGDYTKTKIILGTTNVGNRTSATSSIEKREDGFYELNLFNSNISE